MSKSPQITRLEWGTVEAVGVGVEKDMKLFPGGGRAWDWGETGTRHTPGIRPEDVQELIDRGCEIVVLSRGMHLALQTMPETLALLAGRGIAVHVLETRDAARLYNDLALSHRVGGLFHSTC